MQFVCSKAWRERFLNFSHFACRVNAEMHASHSQVSNDMRELKIRFNVYFTFLLL